MPDIKMQENSFKVYYDKLYHQYPDVKFPLFQLPFQKNKLFTGREEQLRQINEYLITQNTLAITSSTSSQAQTVVGLGGIGKTQLVIEYAYQAQVKNTYQIIWFLNGHNLDADYLTLAAQLKVYGDSKEEVVELTKNKLQKLGNYLLVIDDAEDYESVKDYLPKTGSNGHVLITARNKSHWQQILELGVFDLETEALPYFKKFINYSETSKNLAIYLVDTLLGRLPLALTQAGAFIQHTGITIEKYIEYFETQIKKLWQEEKKPEDYSATITVTWNITLNQIKKTHPQVEDLLYGMSLLAPAPNAIEQSWLSSVVNDELNRREGLGELVKYSMIDTQDIGYLVHQLVQEVIYNKIPKSEKLKYILSIFNTLYEDVPFTLYKKMSDFYRKKILLPHFEKLFKCVLKKPKFMENKHDNNSDKPIKCDFDSDLLEIKKTEHYLFLSSLLGKIASIYCDLGDLDKQLIFLKQNLYIDEISGNKDNLSISFTLSEMATAYGEKGNVILKKNLLEKAKPYLEEFFGADNPPLPMILTNLGNAYGALGDAKKQIEFLERALKIDEKFFTHDNPEIAKTLASLANAYLDLNDVYKARSFLERALKIERIFYGDNHPEVGKTLNNLSNVYKLLEMLSESKSAAEKAQKIFIDYYGAEHMETAKATNNIGSAYLALGDIFKAKKMFETAYISFQKFAHPDQNITLKNLGEICVKLNDWPGAIKAFEEALSITEKFYDKNHPIAGYMLFRLATIYWLQSNNFVAHNCACRAYNIFLNSPNYGVQHEVTQKLKILLVAIEEELSASKENLSQLKNTDLHSLAMQTSPIYLAVFLYQKNRLNESIEFCKQAVRLNKEDAEAWYWLAILNWHLHPGQLSQTPSPVPLPQFCFQKTLLLKPNANVYCEYGLYLLQTNQETKFQLANQQFQLALSLLPSADHMIRFNSIDKIRLDQYLQKELANQKTCQFELLALIHYALIQCYQGLQEDIALVEQLDQLTNLVEYQNKPHLYRLLSYVNEMLGDQKKADELLAKSLQLEEDQRAKSMNFGLAKLTTQYGMFSDSADSVPSSSTATSSSYSPTSNFH